MSAFLLRRCGLAGVAIAAMVATAASQNLPPPQGGNPVCQRLEGQLAALDRGFADPARADQIRRYEDALNRQQSELDRTQAQSQRFGCERSGFFLFGSQSPQCGPLNQQIQQMRANIDRIQGDLQRLQSNVGGERENQRHALVAALAQADCGDKYRAAAAAAQPRGLFETLFGGRSGGGLFSPNPDMMQSTGYRTICVRTCDGFYYPISFSTVQSRFRDDEATCRRMCPASEVMLFSYRNPGEEVAQAVSMSGKPYSELPNAFKYRQKYNPDCSCRKPGESWAEALRGVDDRGTIERGDILVTEERAKALSQPTRDANGKPIRPDPRTKNAKSAAAAPAQSTPAPAVEEGPSEPPAHRTVRTVGPPFMSER